MKSELLEDRCAAKLRIWWLIAHISCITPLLSVPDETPVARVACKMVVIFVVFDVISHLLTSRLKDRRFTLYEVIS